MNSSHVRNALTLMFILTLSNLAATVGTQVQVNKLRESVAQLVQAANTTSQAADHTATAAAAVASAAKAPR
jgi:hypothetical protein